MPATSATIVPDEGHLHVILDDRLISMTGDTHAVAREPDAGATPAEGGVRRVGSRAVRSARDRRGRLRGAAVSRRYARAPGHGPTAVWRSPCSPASACCCSGSGSSRRPTSTARGTARRSSSCDPRRPRSWCRCRDAPAFSPWLVTIVGLARRRPGRPWSPDDRSRLLSGRRRSRSRCSPRSPRRRCSAGAAYGWLERYGPAVAILGSALLFAAMHVPLVRRGGASRSTSGPGSCSRGSDGPRAPGPFPRRPMPRPTCWR